MIESKVTELFAIDFCKAWNNLDVSYIATHLDIDFEYSSQMVLSNINGKENYLEYLSAKFKAVKNGNNPVKVELGYYGVDPCFILIQTLDEPEPALYSTLKLMPDGSTQKFRPMVTERVAIVLLTIVNDKIKSAALCGVAPDINQIKRTGVFPK